MVVVSNLSARMWLSMRIISNSVILLLMVWALSVSALAFLNITIHFPWVVSDANEIPFHRVQTMRIGVMLTFSYYGLLHLIGKSQQFYPLHFLTTYLFICFYPDLLSFTGVAYLSGMGCVLFLGMPYFLLPCCGSEANKYLKYKSGK